MKKISSDFPQSCHQLPFNSRNTDEGAINTHANHAG